MTEEEYKRWKERLRGSLSVEQRESLDAQVEKTTRPEPIQETEVVTPSIAPEVLEARQIAEQELSNGHNLNGTELGVTAALGLG